MKRNKKRKKLKKTIFIICEGQNTEPIYFGGLTEQIEYSNTSYSFRVIIAQTNKTNPIGLVQEAKKLISNSNDDEAWVVFDKDGYTKHKETFKLARKDKRIHIAFSSIAFEIWVLLHFEKNIKSFEKSKYIINYLKNNNYFQKYNKSISINLYKKLRYRTFTAIDNSTWLRYKLRNKIEDNKFQIYDLNPYTNVDELVVFLLQLKHKVYWKPIGAKLDFKNCTLEVNNIEKNKNNYVLKLILEPKYQEHSNLILPELVIKAIYKNNKVYQTKELKNRQYKLDTKTETSVIIPTNDNIEIEHIKICNSQLEYCIDIDDKQH